jgi:MSHA pilin protein MshD
LAIATSLLEEIELRPYTFCETSDPNVYTAPNTAGCTTPEANVVGENRYSPPRFDNVKDYDNFRMGSGEVDPNVRTAANAIIPDLANYKVVVAVSAIASIIELQGSGGDAVPITEALRITVTTTHVPTGITTSLQGYRTRYAPNSP